MKPMIHVELVLENSTGFLSSQWSPFVAEACLEKRIENIPDVKLAWSPRVLCDSSKCVFSPDHNQMSELQSPPGYLQLQCLFQ